VLESGGDAGGAAEAGSMSNKAHRARRDASEPDVIEALEACGWSVRKIAQRGLPDLVIWKHQEQAMTAMWFIECKTGKGKLRATQDWASQGLTVPILRSADEALAWSKEQ
jgi:hypothetical protein